jgi:DNA mismatch repair protein MutS2
MYIFPPSSLLFDEFTSIKKIMANHCISESGKAMLEAVVPCADASLILNQLGKTEEFKKIVAASENFPSDNYKDLRKELSLLRIENSVLQPDQVLKLLMVTKTIALIDHFFSLHAERYPLLLSIMNGVKFEQAIVLEIEKVLDDNGVVKSTASPELQHIRRALLRMRSEADRVYQQVISKYKKGGWLTDSEESSRNGRRVLSVVAEQKRSLRGIIHDVSATGKTAFIEPQEVVGINNNILQLEQDERLEILRLLRTLTQFLRPYQFTFDSYSNALTQFDFIRAKAIFALRINAVYPTLNASTSFNLQQARHPLLQLHNAEVKKATIPFDLKLDAQNRMLIISGPNAGGKTVCMKTIGLLQLMLQAGMLVSVGEQSSMCIFNNLLIDIGDSQSIEYELSTYSSRLQHMKVFLNKADDKSLILIDEFGSGTDPDLGGALAEALLERFNECKSIGVITTHYMNLKVLADKTPGLFNGSMLFDVKNLKPLFQLQTGKPGSSYTFVVAGRSGIPPALIDRARSKVSRKHLVLEKLLNKVEIEKNLIAKKLAEAEIKERKLRELIQKNERMIFENEQLKTGMEHHLQKEEEKITNRFEARLKRFAKDFKEAKNKKHVVDKFMTELGLKKNARQAKEIKRTIDARIKVGSPVKLYNGKVEGIVELIENNKATVVFGMFKTRCNLIDLVLVEPPSPDKNKKDK